MANTLNEILYEPTFSWRRIAHRATRFVRANPLLTAVVTVGWWILPNPLLVPLPGAGGAVPPPPAGAFAVQALAAAVVWLITATALRAGFARFVHARSDDEASAIAVAPPAARSDLSRRLVRFALAMGRIWLAIVLVAGVTLFLLGLMILPATRVDGEALFSGLVAPIVVGLVVAVIRSAGAPGLEAVIQHNESVRDAFRRGRMLFRERRFHVFLLILAAHLFYALEPLATGIAPGTPILLETARVVAAVVRSGGLLLLLSWYHEARLCTDEELE